MYTEKRSDHKIDFKILFGYFISYIIIISLLFFAIGGYSYITIVSERRNSAKEEIGVYTNRKMDILDEKLSDCMRISMSFYQDMEVARIRMLDRNFQPLEYQRFRTLSKSLTPYAGGDFMEQIGLYFHGNEVLISSDMIDKRPWVYYDLAFDINGDYETFRKTALEQEPGSFYLLKETQEDKIMLAHSLPYSDSSQGVTVFTLLDISGILNIEDIRSRYKSAAVQLTDAGGRVLYRTGSGTLPEWDEPQEWDSGVYEYYEEKSGMLGWAIQIRVEKRELYADSLAVQKNITVIFLSFLFISLVLGGVFARRTSKPVTELIKICDDEGNETERQAVWELISGAELRQIVHKVSGISRSNSLLSTQVQNYRDGIKASFFKKLLGGEMIPESEIEMIRDDIQSLFGHSCYTVAVLKLVGLKDTAKEEVWPRSSTFISVFAYLEQNREKEAYCCMTGSDQAAVILCESVPDSREGMETYLSRISASLLQTGYKVCWLVGQTVKNLDQIFMSNQNALQALGDLDAIGAEKYVLFADSEKRQIQVSYTVEDEQRLLHALAQGEAAAAKRLTQELFLRNKHVLEKSAAGTKTFISALTATVIRALDYLTEVEESQKEEIQLNLWQMKNTEDTTVLERYMGIIAGLFADILDSKNESRHQRLLDRIKKLIHENYNDPELCLSLLAEKLSLTESYVSSFFKQYSGKNISQYIENVRMQKAKELLLETGMSTAQISGAVGYNTPNTFYKAFKRHFGINPKAYREQQRPNENDVS